jgi:diaminohydroxyphosphoribosylaminopyrimidine deaminase / 5-amino-6-(5-phosphoribosylamino)uracil reductase
MLVHKWRAEESAIMVGTNTAQNDNPKLNVRDWVGKNPTRIVIDRTLRLPQSLHLFDSSVRTIVFTEVSKIEKEIENVEFVTIPFECDLPNYIVAELYKRNIQSVIIEGGARLLQTFIDTDYWDEALVFVGEKQFGNGIKCPQIKTKAKSIEKWEKHSLFFYSNVS